MVLDASLLSTQHYKVRIKGKVEQSRKGVAPSPTHWCSSYRKGSLRVTLDYGRQLIRPKVNSGTGFWICILKCCPLARSGSVGCNSRKHQLHLCRRVRISQRVLRGPVDWSNRKHQLHLCSGVRLSQRVPRGSVDWGNRKHQLHLCRGVRLSQRVLRGPVDWSNKKHRLHLCRGVRLSQRLYWMWY